MTQGSHSTVRYNSAITHLYLAENFAVGPAVVEGRQEAERRHEQTNGKVVAG